LLCEYVNHLSQTVSIRQDFSEICIRASFSEIKIIVGNEERSIFEGAQVSKPECQPMAADAGMDQPAKKEVEHLVYM
jgi:hypothetical protein